MLVIVVLPWIRGLTDALPWVMEARTSENAPRFGELSKLLPVVVVISMIVFLYVEYVFLHCMRLLQMDMPHFYRKKDDVARAQLQLVVFHFFTFLLFYCFGKCVLTFPGTVPDGAGWDLSDTSTSDAHAVASFTEKKTYWRTTALQMVSQVQARPMPSLSGVQRLCSQDGPSLPMGVQLHRLQESQVLFSSISLYRHRSHHYHCHNVRFRLVGNTY